MRLIPVLIFLIFVSVNQFGQTILAINFDEVKEKISNETSPLYYPYLLEKFTSNDSNITDEEYYYIYYGSCFQQSYNPYGKGENEKKFNDLFRSGEYLEALPLAEAAFAECPVNTQLLFRIIQCYYSLNEREMAEKYIDRFTAILRVIKESGDGKSIKTAFVVLSVSDEYMICSNLGLDVIKQSLVDGPTDILYFSKKSRKQAKYKDAQLYFNVSKPFEYLSRQFDEKTD